MPISATWAGFACQSIGFISSSETQPVVAEPSQLLEDRRELEVAVAGENAVAVGRQLARDAGEVAELHKGEAARRVSRRGPRTCSGPCSSGRDRD